MNIILFNEYPNDGFIPVADERAKHIVEILKLKVGDEFRMGIVNQSEGKAKVEAISLEGVKISYESISSPELYPVTLLCAQVRPICMKRILREAVSLGVGRIILTGSDTGEKSYLSSNLYKTDEYKEYLLDGAMQSSHAGIPQVFFTNSVDGALNLIKDIGMKEDEKCSLIVLDNVVGAVPLSTSAIKKSAVLAIGPERGWSQRERNLFVANGFAPMLLGSRVLRTETACSAGVAVLLSRMKFL